MPHIGIYYLPGNIIQLFSFCADSQPCGGFSRPLALWGFLPIRRLLANGGCKKKAPLSGAAKKMSDFKTKVCRDGWLDLLRCNIVALLWPVTPIALYPNPTGIRIFPVCFDPYLISVFGGCA